MEIDSDIDCDSDDTDCETYKGDIRDGANSTDSVNNWFNNLFGIGFDYTNYILDCIPSFVNNDDKWMCFITVSHCLWSLITRPHFLASPPCLQSSLRIC